MALYLAIALSVLADYGPTWDCAEGEYPYGERLLAWFETGDDAFLDLARTDPAPKLRQPHPDFDEQRQNPRWAHPFGPLLSGIACRLLWTELGWMGAMEAHHVVIPLFVALALYVLVRFLALRIGPIGGAAAGLLLIASPRFFAHSMHNLKDGPETALYFLSAMAGYAALRSGKLLHWAASGALAGAALAQKPNALFLPPHLIAFAVLALLLQRWTGERTARGAGRVVEDPARWSWRGFALAAFAMLAGYWILSPSAWRDPIGEGIEHIVRHVHVGNPDLARRGGVEVPEMGDAPLLLTHGLLHVLWTTPLPLLLLALVGLFERRLSPVARLFLATGVAVPVGRTLLPGMVDFNGVRHFLEFYPFLAALGGAGLALLVRKLAGLGRVGVVAAAGAVALTLAPGALATARTNPNGICYFNALVGGLSGARERGLFGAVDYWGNSYWQGLRWVAEDAPSGARVLALAAEWIALASGPVLLPPEVEFWRVGDAEPEGPLYVVSLLTDAWSGPTQLRIDRSREAEHEILVQGAPILRVHRLSAMAEIGEVLACWRAEAVARAAIERGWEWLEANPEFAPHLYVPLSTYGREGPEAALAQVKLILPETLHEGLAEALWYQMSLLSPTAPSLPPLPPE